MAVVNIDRVMEAAQDEEEYIGFCVACGEEQEGVEPDARRYECESCGEDRVYGAQEILLSLVVGPRRKVGA